MPFPLEYPMGVNRSGPHSVPAPPAIFGALLLPLLFISFSFGQGGSSGAAHGGGGATASAQSFSHSGYAPPTAVSAHSGSSHSSSSGWSHNNAGSYHRHHAANGGEYYPYIYPYLYAVPFPYAADQDDADDSSGDDDADYQGGPTVFDRRGLGAASYIPPTYDGPAHAQDASSGQASASESAADQAPQVPTNPTTLVFKNGQQIEVSNYAIVSQTLYDLTPGHHRKIALADLNLPATQQLNDDRGVDFQLPSLPEAN
jgi:hypothetical protein